jgi:hypothetical protein
MASAWNFDLGSQVSTALPDFLILGTNNSGKKKSRSRSVFERERLEGFVSDDR